MKIRRIQWLSALLLLAVTLSGYPALAPHVSAQTNSLTFTETGKTISGKFLQYWTSHGGLAQQGFPISGEMQEKSDTDGKTYTVQYFERAVFEMHPENPAPNDVLLSLLGVFFYQQKYGTAGATGQLPNSSAGSVQFPQTGKRLGGTFLEYWNTHGGVAQQGYPISDPFVETSATDGKQYTVQYFERAVFEMHPELPAPNNVLLSLLGRFQYDRKYGAGAANGSPTAKPVAPTAQPGAPTATAVPTTPPGNSTSDCSGIPASINQVVTPNCGPAGTTFRFRATGFNPGELVGIYATQPDQAVFGAPFQEAADQNGVVDGITLQLRSGDPLGVWANTMEGTQSHKRSIGYFKLTGNAPPPTALPGATAAPAACDTSHSVDGQAVPSGGTVGTRINITARGFQVGERVSLWFTTPDQSVVGTQEPAEGLVNSNGTIGPLPITITSDLVAAGTGTWAITFQGESSKHQSVVFFCVSK